MKKKAVSAMKRTDLDTRRPQRRSGFTLIELLVVITIIAVLVGLILPAIMGARTRAQVTAVSTEIKQLETAVGSFKSKFGVDPPSSLTIPTAVTGWSAEDRQKITRIWGQFNFATLGGMNGGYPASPIYLNGAECLVFFLGGVNGNPDPAGEITLIGFSKNLATPWSRDGGNRDEPFFKQFDGRLVDVDGDGAPEFLDSLPGQNTPYLFLSSQGKSYTKSNNASEQDDFDVHGGPSNANDMSQIYLKADNRTAQNPGGFQIISPGLDGLYGVGGMLDESASQITGMRSTEADNITNFSGGALKP
jgi:prepilin-type N-terminal cleavage/methylation domain-containing protein